MPRRTARGTAPRARRAAAAAALLALLPGCPPLRDRVAREDVESLQTNVHEMESVIRARQAGVIEQLRELREEQSRLDRLLQESQHQARGLEKRVDQLGESTREELGRRDRLLQESSRAAEARAGQLAERVEALGASVQAGLRTVNDNLAAMSEFEKKQEERIVRAHEQVQGQLKVIVEEVGQANAGLERSVAALRADLDAAREEQAASRQALGELQQAMQQIAERLAATQGETRELGKRIEALRKAPARAGGVHVVRAGETLTAIASRYGVSVEAILQRNQLADADALREGQKLAIPEP